jgi:hypothetical protein
MTNNRNDGRSIPQRLARIGSRLALNEQATSIAASIATVLSSHDVTEQVVAYVMILQSLLKAMSHD